MLVEWALEGLSEEKAMKQPEATFKIRHLKMGITLATALLNCEPSISMALVVSQSCELWMRKKELLLGTKLETCSFFAT